MQHPCWRQSALDCSDLRIWVHKELQELQDPSVTGQDTSSVKKKKAGDVGITWISDEIGQDGRGDGSPGASEVAQGIARKAEISDIRHSTKISIIQTNFRLGTYSERGEQTLPLCDIVTAFLVDKEFVCSVQSVL